MLAKSQEGYLDGSNRFHGFLLRDGSYTTIDVPGSTYTEIAGINDADQIVGVYRDAMGNNHPFLASPVPEVPTLLLLATGIILVFSLKYRWNRP